MDRLSSGEGETETYDELSNLVTKGAGKYAYQDPDEPDSDQMRLASFDNGTVYSYAYDSNGNPTAITNRFSSLSYDSLNALRQIVHAQTDDYWYNEGGLRVKKTEDAGGTWKTTYTLYEGDNILMQEQYNNSGRLQVVFNIIVNGQILAQYKRVYPSTDSVVFFYVDYLGSRRVVINSSGAVMDRYRYSAWGTSTQDVGTDDYRSFTGKDYDATGILYFNARYYDPMTGRFLTEDPARKGGNWYAYCGNNPVILIDPTGKEDNDKSREGIPVAEKIGKAITNAINTVAISTPKTFGEGQAEKPPEVKKLDNGCWTIEKREAYATVTREYNWETGQYEEHWDIPTGERWKTTEVFKERYETFSEAERAASEKVLSETGEIKKTISGIAIFRKINPDVYHRIPPPRTGEVVYAVTMYVPVLGICK